MSRPIGHTEYCKNPKCRGKCEMKNQELATTLTMEDAKETCTHPKGCSLGLLIECPVCTEPVESEQKSDKK